MIRHKWIIGFRNTLANLSMECDSCAAIECARLSRTEREELQKSVRKIVKYIDDKLR